MIIKPIKDFMGYYTTRDGKIVCDLGKRTRRDIKGQYEPVPFYEIKPRPTKNGYMRVYMRNDKTNKRIDKYVHRLIAEAYIPNPNNKKYVNHKDCNRSRNCLSNLEWSTAKENTNQTLNLNHIKRDEKTGRYYNPTGKEYDIKLGKFVSIK